MKKRVEQERMMIISWHLGLPSIFSTIDLINLAALKQTRLIRDYKSSRRRRLTASSHTTGHAGPHPAVHREWHTYFCAGFSFVSCRGCSALCTTPTGFTHFVCTVVPLSEVGGLLCSSLELLVVLILSIFSPSRILPVLCLLLTPVASIWHHCQTYFDSRTTGLPR